MKPKDRNIIELAGSSERFVRVEEIARMLEVKPQTVIDWARRYDDFPMVQLPGSLRVRPSEVAAWLSKLTEKGRAAGGRPSWKRVRRGGVKSPPPSVVVTENPETEKIA
jgi:Mn-dependent DtxR family transcriptional regulator